MPDGGATTTILFTDLVDSTELLERAGDEAAYQLIFKTHRQLLSEAAAASGGREVKWTGDGLMVAFASAADAVRCAIAMQQASRRPSRGERLRIRVGLNTGDALGDESDYFGTPVVVARRLCDRAQAGQILCSSVVSLLLAGRQAFHFRQVGPLSLKGFAAPFDVCEVAYDAADPGVLLNRIPFVGRLAEVAKLRQGLANARAGHGGLVMVAGEPGIGKTRMMEEFATLAQQEGSVTLWGRCLEGEWAPPYGPFSEALAEYGRSVPAADLALDLGNEGPILAQLAPTLRAILPDLPAVLADSEADQFQLLEAMREFLATLARRRPLLLVLDDLHWADSGTLDMLRHVARSVRQEPILMVGLYRDVELDRHHPLSDVLAALRRDAEYDRIALHGLRQSEVGELLASLAEQAAPPALVEAIATETDGNPFFIREVLLYLLEEGKLYRDDGRWTTSLAIADVGIPEGVRQVIGRRLARLSESARRLLSAASAFDGAFPFAVATRAAGVDETDALDALDEALTAQLVQPAADPDGYEFSHALIRHTLYEEINPSRRVRLHRDIAVALEEAFAGQLDAREMEVAHHYREAGQIADPQAVATHCLRAGSRAYAAFSYAEAIRNWEAGLAASARLPGFPPLERALALRDLARALHVSGRGRGAEFAIIDEALALFRELGTNELVAEALVFRSGMHSMNLRAREALADIEAARELMDAGSGQPPSPSALRLRSRILEQLCQRYTMIRRYSRAESVAAEALRVAQEVHDSALVAEAHLARALCLFQWLRMRDAVAAFDDCLAAAAVHAQGAGYAAWPFAEAASNRKALALTGLGRLDDARPLAIEGREFFARIGDPYRLSWARLTLALGAALRGDLAAARAEAETALEEGGAATSGIVAMTVTPVLVHVECLAGDFGSARRHADDLLARQRDEGSASVLPQALAFRALVESAAGNRDEAIRLAQELTIGFNPRTPDLVALLAHVALAEVAVRFRDASIASLVLAPLEELDKQGVVFTLYWPALLPRLLAGLARVLGQHDAARGYLARAIGLASEASAHPELALCNLEAAWLWHDEGAEGDATEVTRKLDQVESIAVEHGLKSLEAPLAEARAALERSLPSS